MFKIGQLIRVVPYQYVNHCDIGFVPPMAKYCDKISTIRFISDNGIIQLDIDNGMWWWHPSLVDPVDIREAIRMYGSRSVLESLYI